MASFVSCEMRNNSEDHATDLIIGAFFFAMRSCEFTKVTVPGKTITIRLGGVKFYTTERREIPHEHPRLIELAEYVWILFEDQKNREKCESRTQRRTNDLLLCPVLRFGRAVQRVKGFVKNANKDTPLCAINCPGRRAKFITQNETLLLIRKTCRDHGGKQRFGFAPSEIGNKSIRSGAAMALFINDHSSEKIMILGRWKSRAFLAYIRPQVVEWAESLSVDMISFNNFFELCSLTSPKEDENEIQKNHYNIPNTML